LHLKPYVHVRVHMCVCVCVCVLNSPLSLSQNAFTFGLGYTKGEGVVCVAHFSPIKSASDDENSAIFVAGANPENERCNEMSKFIQDNRAFMDAGGFFPESEKFHLNSE
jgi:hypothetical protein